jgi:hypothetical protein
VRVRVKVRGEGIEENVSKKKSSNRQNIIENFRERSQG